MLIRAKDGKRNWSRRAVFSGAILASAALGALATPRPAEAQSVYNYGYPGSAYSYSQNGSPDYWASPSYGYPSYGGGEWGHHRGWRERDWRGEDWRHGDRRHGDWSQTGQGRARNNEGFSGSSNGPRSGAGAVRGGGGGHAGGTGNAYFDWLMHHAH
jgi:hypothetical protein